MSWIEHIWYNNSRGYWLLLPFAWLYGAITALRRGLFRLGVKQQVSLPVPVIVVGNISVGGTGKTPFTLRLCQMLQQQGWTPGIVSRGYGAVIKAPLRVTADASAAEVGDEPLLLARRSGCPVVVCPNRVAAGRYLLQQTACDIIISDDGLQHYALGRDLEIVLIDGTRGLGNGQLLPAGPLREKAWRLAKADLIVANTQSIDYADGVMLLKPGAATALTSEATLSPCQVSLVAGIGNPKRFEQTATQAGFSIDAAHYFPDHHQFCAADFDRIVPPVLMTEKDAVKCRSFAAENWYSLTVSATLDQAVEQKLTALLSHLRSSYGT